MEIAIFIKKLRTELGLSQEQFGLLINKHRTTINKYESGEASPKLKDYLKIKELENMGVDELRKLRPDLWPDCCAA